MSTKNLNKHWAEDEDKEKSETKKRSQSKQSRELVKRVDRTERAENTVYSLDYIIILLYSALSAVLPK